MLYCGVCKDLLLWLGIVPETGTPSITTCKDTGLASIEDYMAGVAKPLPGGKKVPTKAFSSALQTFLKIKFVKLF